MNSYKKKTMALVLASALTVVGSFASEKYKNTLMSLDLESGTNGAVTIILQTQKPYNSSINLVKKDSKTYVIMLPEFNSNAPTPNLTNTTNILSVRVDTRPYAADTNGYTKITVTTNGSATIFPQSKLFVPKHEEPMLTNNKENTPDNFPITNTPKTNAINTAYTDIKTSNATNLNQPPQTKTYTYTEPSTNGSNSESQVINTVKAEEPAHDNTQPTTVQIPDSTTDSSTSWIFIGAIAAMLSAIGALILGKKKMSELLGNNIDIKFDDAEETESKKKVINQPKAPKTTTPKPIQKTVKQPIQNYTSMKESTVEQVFVEKMNVIDMDELFNSQNNSSPNNEEDNTNEALEDFLSSYYNDNSTEETTQVEATTEEEEEEKETEDELIKENIINEELYNSILQNKQIKFSQQDIVKIKTIMETEITEDIKIKVKEITVTKPSNKPKIISKFENLITEYYTKQNISFNSDDIKIIHKLMDVELDSDFVTDLRTNIKKSGTKQIQSTEQTQNIVNSAMPVLQNNNDSIITNKNTSIVTPPRKETYEVPLLRIEDSLPDLQDVLAHPEKYEEPMTDEVVVDEDSLLESLSNVQFKPFYSEESATEISEISYEEEIAPDNDSTGIEELFENSFVSSTDEEETSSANEQIKIQDTLSNNIEQPVAEKETTQLSIEEQNEINIDNTTSSETLIVDNNTYEIKSVSHFNENAGIYLAKSDKLYAVFGFVGENLVKLNTYDTLKSEKVNTRINETFENGNVRYLVKIGLKKFVADFDGSNITYVMDLC